uniref:Uncharacterized protein n=1 Tax=Arundo donax TaxID=35708 RepID=A0A0A9F405_ARUDO
MPRKVTTLKFSSIQLTVCSSSEAANQLSMQRIYL